MHIDLIVPNGAIHISAELCTIVQLFYKQSNELGQDGKEGNEKHS